MPKKKMMVEWEDDAQLSESRKKPGQKSPLTRNAKNKLSHVTLSEDPEDESTANFDPALIAVSYSDDSRRRSRDDDIVESIANLLLYAMNTAPEWGPVVHQWWSDRGLLAMKSAWNRLPRVPRKRAQQMISAGQVEFETSNTDEPLVTDIDAPRASMRRKEARDRLEAALAARRFSEEQLEILRGARIIDDDLPEVEGKVGLAAVSAKGSTMPSLELPPTGRDEGCVRFSLSEATVSAVMDHAYVPVKPAKVQRALRQRRVR